MILDKIMNENVEASKKALKWLALPLAIALSYSAGKRINNYLYGSVLSVPQEAQRVQQAEVPPIGEQSTLVKIQDLDRVINEPRSLDDLADEGKPRINVKTENNSRLNYESFPYYNEIGDILKHSQRLGVEPELIMAIRCAENGDDRIAYGILPQGRLKSVYSRNIGYNLDGEFYQYKDVKEKQLVWAVNTVRNNMRRFKQNPKGHKDFISYLTSIYCPIGASNDPKGLNRNWQKNVRRYYSQFKSHSLE